MSSDLWSNEYGDPAGKGTKDRTRRERLELKDINARTMKTKRTKPKPRPYSAQKPEHEVAKAKKIKLSESYHNAMGIRQKLHYLIIDHDMSYLTMLEALKQQGTPLSGVTVVLADLQGRQRMWSNPRRRSSHGTHRSKPCKAVLQGIME